jgi:hypothetical protein
VSWSVGIESGGDRKVPIGSSSEQWSEISKKVAKLNHSTVNGGGHRYKVIWIAPR